MGTQRRARIPRAAVFSLLVLLSAWGIGYELSLTVMPRIQGFIGFRSVGPDVLFALAGLLLVARGISGNRGWLLFGAGALCWAAGDVYWSLKLATSSSPPVPSWADAGYLSFCPLAFAGILLLIRREAPRAGKAMVLDALAAALAAGALSAAVVVHPVLDHASGGVLAVATNLAYPLADLLLLGLIVGAISLSGWHLNRLWVLLAASVIVFWIADSFYLVKVATNTYAQTQWFNPLWYCSPVLAAWAAWLSDSNTRRSAPGRPGVRGIVMPLLFGSGALAILVWSSFDFAGVPAILLATGSLLVILARLAVAWRENTRLLRATQDEATTDALTGLRNRRALLLALERKLERADQEHELTLMLFDLDGFKYYNDNFGHPAGDALLQRLGNNLAEQVGACGTAYRMGGDEFCALVDLPLAAVATFASAAAAALSDRGEGFSVSCSYGFVGMPSEASDTASALRIADQRMYAHKRGGRASASHQSKDVLLRALAERDPDLDSHVRDVAELAGVVATRFGMSREEVERIQQAAELHDVGKVAIPDAILNKPGSLDQAEWEFVRRHTEIGERIIAAAPALRDVAALVRSSHENFDGTGYPDRLAGDEIPLGSRMVAVCDAFNAMTTDRPYRAAIEVADAIAELRRCAGTQFDPHVIDVFCRALAERELELVS